MHMFYTNQKISDCYTELCQHSKNIFNETACGYATVEHKTEENKCVPRTPEYNLGYRARSNSYVFISDCYKTLNGPNSSTGTEHNEK